MKDDMPKPKYKSHDAWYNPTWKQVWHVYISDSKMEIILFVRSVACYTVGTGIAIAVAHMVGVL